MKKTEIKKWRKTEREGEGKRTSEQRTKQEREK